MNIHSKVRVLRDGKYVVAIVTEIERALGFRKQYVYERVWVEFIDGTTREYRGYDCIEQLPKEPKESVDKKSNPKV